VKDIPLGKVGELQLVGVVSRNEQERCAKLREYFDKFLGDWLEKVMSGVRYSPGVNRELVEALILTAAAAGLADPRVPDEIIERRAQEFVKQAVELLEGHARAQLADAGVESSS
jgi:hypothetical protein